MVGTELASRQRYRIRISRLAAISGLQIFLAEEECNNFREKMEFSGSNITGSIFGVVGAPHG